MKDHFAFSQLVQLPTAGAGGGGRGGVGGKTGSLSQTWKIFPPVTFDRRHHCFLIFLIRITSEVDNNVWDSFSDSGVGGGGGHLPPPTFPLLPPFLCIVVAPATNTYVFYLF